jgi:hypothetical protein
MGVVDGAAVGKELVGGAAVGATEQPANAAIVTANRPRGFDIFDIAVLITAIVRNRVWRGLPFGKVI